MQVEYGFYTDTYGGTNISEAAWKRLSQKAIQRLRFFTFGRIPEEWTGQIWENKAKCAVCEMSEILFSEEKRNGKTSENTDGYAVSYESADATDLQLRNVAYVYLGSTGLMYLGDDEEC